ncbi:unnamed protein product [Allacma fusca]|uniref:Uncharacterized protein n=1 Tax=Allacma fusca TaxID=39272 RepID=A0A8J2L4R8_9HEXA|nr:unnamed protein product [Allacma fusca]
MEWKTALFLSLLTGIYLTWAENETNESLNDVDHDDRVFNGTPHKLQLPHIRLRLCVSLKQLVIMIRETRLLVAVRPKM